MGDRYDDADTHHLGGEADTDYLGEPQYSYTEEEPTGGPDEPAGPDSGSQADAEPEEAPLLKEEQDKRVRRVAAIGTIAGLLVGAVVMLVVIALAGGDPEPAEEVAVDEGQAEQVEELEGSVEELEAAVEERDAQIEALEAQLAEAQAVIEERDAELEGLRQQAGEGETELAEERAALEEQRAALDSRTEALDEREQALDQREEALAEREAEPPATDSPGTDPGEDLPVDEEEAEALVERVLDRIRDLFD